MKKYSYILCIVLTIFSSQAAEFDLGTRGTLSISIPDDWSINSKVVTRADGSSIGYTFAIKPRNDANAKCLLSLAYTTNGAPDKAAVHKEVLRTTKQFVSASVEKKQTLKDFSLGTGFGSYCLFTDASLVGKEPEPGNYKVMAGGQVQPGDDLIGVVSLLADDADGLEMKAMLKIINSLKVTPRDAK
ncbi:MAG: hypothetical protein ACK4UN_17615 [Limisphaerales bacterium]